MIYVNQSKRNAYLKLDQVLKSPGMCQIQKEDFNDDEDAKDYELLAKTIKDNTNAYNSKLTQQSQKSHKKNFSNLGKEIIMSYQRDKNNGYENKLGKVEELLILTLSKNIKLPCRCLFKKDD